MKTKKINFYGIVMLALLFGACQKEPGMVKTNSVTSQSNAESPISTKKVFAKGLYNPRGLKFGPDGYLYVAEAGKGGANSTVGICEQVPAPNGPFLGSPR